MAQLVAGFLIVAVIIMIAGTFRRRPAVQRRAAPAGGGMIGFLRRHPWARRALSGASVLMIIGSAGVLGYPFYTNLYQERRQRSLEAELASPASQQAYRDAEVAEGDPLMRIVIPAIEVDVVVVEGTTASALRAGAGHYPDTPLPCDPGNVAIAGHQTTYGRPFHNLDLLSPGDTITLETPVGACTNVVDRRPFVVEPTDTSVVGPLPGSTLTLTTCEPKGSARQRLVLRAVIEEPGGLA